MKIRKQNGGRLIVLVLIGNLGNFRWLSASKTSLGYTIPLTIMNTAGISSQVHEAVESPPKLLHFPPEIIYIILEHLGTRAKETIKALCLTSRDFLYPCQRALFTTVDIVTTWPIIDPHSQASRLISALKMTPSLASVTRHFTSHCEYDWNRNRLENITNHILFQLFPLFGNLQTISLDFPRNVSSSLGIMDLNVHARPLAPLMRRPGLVGVTLKSAPADAPQFLSASLLHAILGTLFSAPVYDEYSAPMKFQVESLKLDGWNRPLCFNWLDRLPAQTFAHLRKLSLDMYDYLHYKDLFGRDFEFLERCSSSFPKLEVLSLAPCPCTSE
jgi:hypothetical protein